MTVLSVPAAAAVPRPYPMLLEQAFRHHQGGRLDLAAAGYRRVLADDPVNGAALRNLGVLRRIAGDPAGAERLYHAALRVDTCDGAAALNLGNLLRGQGRLDEAAAMLARSYALEETAASLLALIDTLTDLGRLDQATAAGHMAAARFPDLWTAVQALGRTRFQAQDYGEAALLFRRAAHLAPDQTAPLVNAAVALIRMVRLDAAEACLRRAWAIRPDLSEIHYFFATAAQNRQRVPTAADALRRTLALKPDYWAALYQLGCAYQELAQPDEAAASLKRLLVIDPGNVDGLCVLSNVEMARCGWEALPDLRQRMEALVDEGCGRILPFVLMCLGSGLAYQLAAARNFVQREIAEYGSQRPPLPPLPPPGQRRIRVGYLSCDYHDHATAWLIAGLFEHHDRSRFEIIGLSYGYDNGSAMRRRLRQAMERFIDLTGQTVADVVRTIQGLEIDILVDLKGFTTGALPGLLARKMAPVMVNWLGYPSTLGTDFVDYIIVDHTIAPAEDQPFFAERLVHMPDSYQVNDNRRVIAPRVGSRGERRAAAGLPASGFVFCSFNNLYKITAPVFAVWMRLLEALPGSVLWLLHSNPAAPGLLRRRASDAGIDPKRLIFGPKLPQAEHLARLDLADLFLDTLPVNAHTTASDALWAGLPVLTCLGDSLVGRVAAGLLRATGLPELVTSSLEAYEDMALSLARIPERLAALRERLVENRRTCALFDTGRFTRHLEAAYTRMYARAAAGLPPEAFAVAPLDSPEAALPAPAPSPLPDPVGLLERAFAAHAAGDLLRAECGYRRVLAVQPDQHDAIHLLGMTLKARQNPRAALRWLNRAVWLRDATSVFYANRGNTRLLLADPVGALEDFRAAAGCDPWNSEAHTGMAEALEKLQQRDAAAAAMLRARALKPDPMTLVRLAKLLAVMGRADEAQETHRCAEALAQGRRTPLPAPGASPIRVVVVKPAGYPHAAAFDEVAAMLTSGLKALGHMAECVDNAVVPGVPTILLGAHLLSGEQLARLPAQTVLFNLEQIDDSPRLALFLQAARRHRVWDYSPRNLAALRRILGRTHGLFHVPLGYVPDLTRIRPAAEQDIDVLFYGSVNPRRAAVLKQLEDAGLRVTAVFGVYGAERDALIARAKVVVNIHFYDAHIFEIARVFYLMANAKAVVTECGADTEIDPDLHAGVAAVPYDRIAQSCIGLVGDHARRRRLEAAGFEAISRRPAAPVLRDALAALDAPPPRPGRLNLDGGDGFDPAALNLDRDPYRKSDAVVDVGADGIVGRTVQTQRFGPVTLEAGGFTEITAGSAVGRTPDLARLMTNCLTLLADGGILRITVPYDLSYEAWQDPTQVRAFNERSWVFYTDEFWRLGWQEFRFEQLSCTLIRSREGERLLAAGVARDMLARHPRAIGRMRVELRKRPLTVEERAMARRFGEPA